MQEIGPIMRAIELQRIVEDKVSEWRGMSGRGGGGGGGGIGSTYQPPVNFKRQTHRRKNSAEINRIITKYSKPSPKKDAPRGVKPGDQTRTIPRLTDFWKTPKDPPQKTESPTPPKRPARLKKKGVSNLVGSKSETNLTMIEDSTPYFEKCETFTRTDLRASKYNTKSCEDLTEFCDVECRLKSLNFEERSILSERCAKSSSPTLSFNTFPDIIEEVYDSDEQLSQSPKLKGSPIAYSTPILSTKLRPKTLPIDAFDNVNSDRNTVSSFSKCPDFKPEVSKLRKGVSEPQLNDPRVSGSQTLGPDSARKRWRILKPPFRKGAFDCLLRWRGGRRPQVSKIQEVDDSFFEKFGSLLKQVSQRAAEEEATPLAPLPQELTQSDAEPVEEQHACAAATVSCAAPDADSGNETLLDTDSEPDDPDKIDLYEQAVGWNIDELYSEILYEILHNVGGCDVGAEVGQLSMLSYAQDAFKVTSARHQQLLSEAEAKEPPEIMLNVEVVEAKDLVPKDPNGLSDPFVTIYLVSNTSHRYNTSVKAGTLNPTWEEHFSLPIPENLSEDSLCLEVWDFDPAETVKEKMGKIFEVKGVRGLRKLMKEIAVTASTGKHDNELIGKANIPLKSIPASGLTMWYSLDKKNRLRRQGVVKLRLNFSSEKNSQVAAQEHRHLLRVLLLHELENSKVAPYWWCGNFSCQAEAIITQHVAQSGLGATDNHLSQWVVYCGVMADHPLSFTLFNCLLDKLVKPMQSGTVGVEEVKLFWDGARKLLPVCFSLIRKLRKKTAGDKTVIKNLKEVLKILYRLSTMDVPESIDLFPSSLYGWLRRNEDGSSLSIHEVMYQGATQGASDWFVHILDNNECKDSSEEGRLQHLIRVIQLVRSDLQRAVEYYDKIFIEMMNFPYAKSLYGLYEGKISCLVEPDVVQVCRSLKRLQYDEEPGRIVTLAGGLNGGTSVGAPRITNEPLAMGTTLFELYLALQRFVTLGQGLNEADWQSYQITKFHSWFFAGVAQWLDIAVFKALSRIEKAVELDQLIPVDATVKYSSSGVDTLAIYYQIKIFWQQLAWPDVEGSYTFVAKIIDDICRCSVFYADKMAARVRSAGVSSSVYEANKFEVTTEWCLAINNIDYVRQALTPFVADLGMEEIIQRMCELKSPIEAQRCKETLQNVIENAIDTVRNKILELLEIMIKKMMPSITRFLVEGAELLNNDCSSMDRVMLYLEANLDTLYSNLNNENFSRTLDIIWEQLSEVLYELIQSNLEHRKPKLNRFIDCKRLDKSAAAHLDSKRRPPSFFANLHECLKIMVRSFRQDGKEIYSSETLKRVEYLLKLHGLETRELIHQFHLERWQEQQTVAEPTMGMLTVRAQFVDDNLKLEIMNARNLVPTDSNGLCDSYVRVTLMPEDTFADTVKPKTQTHNKNLFPLYDEVFHIPLTAEQRAVKDGLVQLVVKDKDLFSVSNQFMGEAYVHFSEIPATPAPLSSLPQVHLALTRPANIDGDAMKALESRQGDRQARDFLKKQKQKVAASGRNFSFSLT